MDKTTLARGIIELLGGKDNISNCTHCVTRLRFNLINDSKANKKAVENLDGVMGLTEQGGQFQVIIGTSVGEVFKAIEPILEMKTDSSASEPKKKFTVMTILDVLTSIISPIIPAFCASGLMKCILLLLTTLNVVDGTEGVFQVFDFISDVAFYFLPVLIAMSAAKRFKTDQGLAICLAGALLYPTFVSMVNDGTALTFLGIPVPAYSYSYTIFPSLLGVFLLSYVNRFWNKVVKWDSFKLLLVPLLSLGITIPIVLLIVAPIGNWMALILGGGFQWMIETLGPVAGLIIGFFIPVMTLTGLHQSLAPIEMLELTTGGFSRILPIEFFHNLAESGAAFGTGIATKDKKLKALAFQTGATAFIGVTEPALYTVMVKDRYAMLSAMIGNGIGGFLSILFGLKMSAYVWPNIFSIPIFLGDATIGSTLIMLLISIIATFAVSFALPIVFKVLGFKQKSENTKPASAKQDCVLHAPFSGKVLALGDVKDEAFSSGVLGRGVAIIPENGILRSPVDGTIDSVAETKHAVMLVSDDGAEILIHIGLDTVNLGGAPFSPRVKDGDRVKTGDVLMEVDFAALTAAGYDKTTPIVVSNAGEWSEALSTSVEIVTTGDVILTLKL
jgi:PTS system beta-glucosides-specific IIC component